MNQPLCTLKFVIIIAATLLFQACATTPIPFEQAAQNLAKKLLLEIKVKTLLSPSGVKKIVVDDFTDEDSGEVVAAGQQIENIIFREAENNFRSFSLSKMNSRNIKYADYVINGVISLERQNQNSKEKFYHVFASATDLATGKIIAKASAWVSGRNLDYAPLREYKDSPMFLTDKWHKSKVVNARGVTGPEADSEYYDSIETGALLTEASAAYGEHQYPKAIMLFEKAAGRPDGQLMKTYAGLYQAQLKVGNDAAAEEAFGKLVEISVANNSLSVKLLFKVDSTQFIDNETLRSRYNIWIRQISKFFNNHDHCVKIIGHSSHTGSADYNKKLSKARAKAVQQLMARYITRVAAKTAILGKGYEENIKGIGTDDGRDAIDRRVEFKVVPCTQI